jgi:hypothetical protein
MVPSRPVHICPTERHLLADSPIHLLTNAMADKFDPYREALIVEVETQWPEEYDDWEPAERARVERLLHQSPDEASHLEYVRTHTGFCRRIVVTPEDLARVGA